MRVLAIGLGGAGSRIVDQLYDQDQRSRVHCVKGFAIDLDYNSLQQLEHLPTSCRLYFPPIDPHYMYDVGRSIQVEEVMTHLHRVDTSQIDAILICCGLGGSLVDAASKIVEEMRKTFHEPIFTVATLPCRKEGRRRTAKAMDDIDMLQRLMDAVILFDNDLWYGRLKAKYGKIGAPSRPTRLFSIGAGEANWNFWNPRDVYRSLNEKIARYLGLMLRAGEFSEKGIEVGEVVLDAGEVLNTITGMGVVAIGYAAEELMDRNIPFIDLFRQKKPPIEEMHEKAARIVSLAKKAVYEETSILCDITSAEKALVLIAGPSRELSMRGFQTVRKWIDRSISGLEMRSGDYPVTNTRFIGIIIVLAGLRNVPRLEELREVREEHRRELGASSIVTSAEAGIEVVQPAPVAEVHAAESSLGTEEGTKAVTEPKNDIVEPIEPSVAPRRRGRWRGSEQAEEDAIEVLSGLRERYLRPDGTRSVGTTACTSSHTTTMDKAKKEDSRGKREEATTLSEKKPKRRRKDLDDFGLTWIR